MIYILYQPETGAYHAQACAKYRGLVFVVATCVNKRNVLELENIRNLMLKAGVRKWRLFTIFPKGRAKQFEELQLNNAEFKQMLDFIADCRKQKKLKQVMVAKPLCGWLPDLVA